MSTRKPTNENASTSRANRNNKTDGNVDLNANDDQLFEPSLEMMVNDFDDESTLELEEKMASTESQDPNAELNSLQREGEMPIEELLALYNCVTPTTNTFIPSGSSKRRSKTSRNAGLEKSLMPPPETPSIIDVTPTERISESIEINNIDKSINETNTTIMNESIDTKPIVTIIEISLSPDINAKDSITETNESDIINSNENAVNIEENKTNQLSQKETDSTIKHSYELPNDKPHVNGTETNFSCDTTDYDVKGSSIDEDIDTKSKSDSITEEEEMKGINDYDGIDETLDEEDEESEEEESELKKLYPETYKTTEPRLLRANSHPNSDDEEEEDNDYSPEEDDFKKKIMVGSEYQAQIPEGLCRYDDALPYENEDKLVWDPSQLQECDIECYLQKANIPIIVGSPSSNSPASPTSQHSLANQKIPLLPNGVHLRDDEGSLFLLLQCGHNTEEALRRRRLNATIPPTATAVAASTASNQSSIENTLWSEEECRNFESGLRVYGKDFHAIQQSKVRTRSVSELVQFYYLWKKTERHDIFANKARLEKKKYNLHPGLTDYMDRFLEEQENNGGISMNNSNTMNSTLGMSHGTSNGNERASRDRSMSPVINSLLYTDCKRQRMAE